MTTAGFIIRLLKGPILRGTGQVSKAEAISRKARWFFS